jgi:hypothetical protein
MDDSEKSYGYSEDLYHGKRPEKSYEYGPEGETADAQGTELAPEEEAIYIVAPPEEEPAPAAEAGGEYDYGRGEPEVESFTWENPVGGEEGEKVSKGADRSSDGES